MIGHFALFFTLLPLTLLLNDVITLMIQGHEYGKHIAFLMMYLLLLPWCDTRKKKVWLVYAILHGMAHIVHPAFHGTEFNPDYTPWWDFIVHAASCLFIYEYHGTTLSKCIGYGVFYSTLIVGYYAHCEKSFLATIAWRILSACGVLGSMYHMLLLDDKTDGRTYIFAVLIWFGPYLGYIDSQYLPFWDYTVNNLGLFNLWFWNWFVTFEIINYLHTRKREYRSEHVE